ncbi:MAG TPA: TonB-dependent receptor [Gemmatimonadaceae bacterium]|nr:TonB-dependent receptor [Gemmatimonadaceae bacterium]
MAHPVAPQRGAIVASLLCITIGVANPHLSLAQNPTLPDTTKVQSPSDTTRSSATDSARIRRLGTVTVTAAPAERAAPVRSTRIDATTIKETPAHNSYDLLRQTAGLEVHEQGQGPGFASNASLRGFSSDHSTDLALWIDGVPINEPVNGHAEGYNDFDVLFPGGVSEFDVIRGPTSALYGNFALAGVVNVRTLERMRGTAFTASGGSFGRADLMALGGFDAGEKGGGVLGARYVHENGFRPNARSDVGQGHARLVRDVAPGVTIDGGLELYGSRWTSAGFLSEDEFARHEYDIVSNPSDGGYKRRAQERVSLRVVRGTSLWRTTVYATQSRWQLFLTIPPAGGRLEGSGSQTEEEDSRYGYGLTTAATRVFSRGELTLGGESRWDKSGYENYFTTARSRDSAALLVDARQLSGAVFLQSHVDLTSRLRADIGARYDELGTRSTPTDPNQANGTLTASHGVFSPKMGSLVKIAPWLGAYVNVSRGFRATDGIISDPTLAPITAWSYETGFKLDGEKISASGDVFRMDVSNEQTFNPLNGNASNGGSSRRKGLELELRAPIAAVGNFTADWTFLDARYRSLTVEDGAGLISLDGLRVYNTATYVGAAAYTLAPMAAKWRVRISGNWVGRYAPFDEPGVLLGGYGLMHVSGTAMLGAMELDVGVRNVLDRAYPELVAGHIVSPGQPRALFVTIRSG